MSRRKRQVGTLGHGWVPLHENILKTEAVRTLPAATFKLFIVVTVLCKPWLNGAVPLARSVLKGFGITAHRTVTDGIEDLIARGLLVRTRKPRPRHAALYGVAHLPLHAEAMAKCEASDPRRSVTPPQREAEITSATPPRIEAEIQPTTRPNIEAEISALHGGGDWPHSEAELAEKSIDSASQVGRISPFSPINSASPVGTSKIYAMSPGANGGAVSDFCAALLQRVLVHGGTATLGPNELRIRWWRGDPPADLDGELRVHARALAGYMRANPTVSGIKAVAAAP